LIPSALNEILYSDMEHKAGEKAVTGIGPLVLALAKTYHWAGLYGTNHPTLAKRVGEMHAALLSRLSHEPEQRLLLGIARDKILYRDEFVGEKQDLVGRLTESLYLRQVATLGFDPAVTPESLLALFRYLHDSIEGTETISPEQFLRESGVRGVSLSPYNYRELLSRKILDPDAISAQAENREQELWRLLLTSDFADLGEETKILDELTDSPTLLNAILRRAKNAESREETPGQEKVQLSGEVLRNVLGRLSTFVRELPTERKQHFYTSIGSGFEDQAGGATGGDSGFNLLITRSLTEMQTDEEFLDLIATLVSLEGKGGERLRKSFATDAGEQKGKRLLRPENMGDGREADTLPRGGKIHPGRPLSIPRGPQRDPETVPGPDRRADTRRPGSQELVRGEGNPEKNPPRFAGSIARRESGGGFSRHPGGFREGYSQPDLPE